MKCSCGGEVYDEVQCRCCYAFVPLCKRCYNIRFGIEPMPPRVPKIIINGMLAPIGMSNKFSGLK